MVPMAGELEHVRNYLEIEKARFEDKLEVSYDLPEQMDIRIPTLILQPLVENAVRYGISPDGRRRVHISVQETEEAYQVSIRDQGRGFPQEVQDKLKKNEPFGGSIGLRNVNQRMKKAYGESFGLDIVSSPEGSCVTLRFLKEKEEEKERENSGN